MSPVVECLLCNGARDRTPERGAFQNLHSGHLVNAHHPPAGVSQADGLGIAPQHLFGTDPDVVIQAGSLPIPRAMRSQVHLPQDLAHRAGADGGNHAVGDHDLSQSPARPVRDVPPLGHGLQASQFDDLSPLQGGKSAGDAPRAERPSAGLPVPPAHRDDSVARPWPHDTAAGGPPLAGVVQHQQPTSSGHVAPETKGGTGYEPCFGEAGHRQLRSSADEAFDHASGHLLCWDSGTLRPSIATCPEFLALLRAGDTRAISLHTRETCSAVWVHTGRVRATCPTSVTGTYEGKGVREAAVRDRIRIYLRGRGMFTGLRPPV